MNSTLNGGIVLGSPAEASKQFVQMRLAISMQIIGHLAADDYSRALQAAVDRDDPLGMKSEDEGVQLSIEDILAKCNPQSIAVIATAYAEHLLIAQGFLKVERRSEAQSSEPQQAAT